MERLNVIPITVEKLAESLSVPVEQEVYLTFQAPEANIEWKCMSKKKNNDYWLFECQVSKDAKPVYILHNANLASEQLLVDVKKILHLMSRDPDLNVVYVKEEWTTNFQDIKSLLSMYTPKIRGVMSEFERFLISQTLHLDRRDILDLRNLRDFVVMFLERSKEQEDIWDNMDKMSAITAVIDQKIWELGGEV